MFRRALPDVRKTRSRLDLLRLEDPELLRLARVARELCAALGQAVAPLDACAQCGRDRELPHGRYDGGYCCGGETSGVFCDDELAALAITGTKKASFRTGHREQAGCVYRSPVGCCLPLDCRPTICVSYFCTDALQELGKRGDFAEVDAQVRQLEEAFDNFRRRRQELLLDELLAGDA